MLAVVALRKLLEEGFDHVQVILLPLTGCQWRALVLSATWCRTLTLWRWHSLDRRCSPRQLPQRHKEQPKSHWQGKKTHFINIVITRQRKKRHYRHFTGLSRLDVFIVRIVSYFNLKSRLYFLFHQIVFPYSCVSTMSYCLHLCSSDPLLK